MKFLNVRTALLLAVAAFLVVAVNTSTLGFPGAVSYLAILGMVGTLVFTGLYLLQRRKERALLSKMEAALAFTEVRLPSLNVGVPPGDAARLQQSLTRAKTSVAAARARLYS